MTMTSDQHDRIEDFMGATIQHGPLSQRIYLMTLGQASTEELLPGLVAMANERGYSKIFAKVPSDRSGPFVERGFAIEARVPGFYRCQEDADLMGYFLTDARGMETDPDSLKRVLDIAQERQGKGIPAGAVPDGTVRRCTPADVEEMATVYRAVFPTYPFPIHDPEYLLKTMNSHIMYFGVERAGQLVSLSSAEVDLDAKAIEMTDFATLPAFRGNGFAVYLLAHMERAVRSLKPCTAYTIARAVSTGMNVTFAKLGYAFCGRLVNNTNISGRIESMNVWHKRLERHSAS